MGPNGTSGLRLSKRMAAVRASVPLCRHMCASPGSAPTMRVESRSWRWRGACVADRTCDVRALQWSGWRSAAAPKIRPLLFPASGPAFAINSPADGSSIAGVTWFSVQPQDTSDVARVDFKAGDLVLGADTTAADGFKVFLAARDHAAGTLRLEATVTGKDGKTASGAISVINVPNPASSTTASSAGETARGVVGRFRPAGPARAGGGAVPDRARRRRER